VLFETPLLEETLGISQKVATVSSMKKVTVGDKRGCISSLREQAMALALSASLWI
jgi:hypothetical protein